DDRTEPGAGRESDPVLVQILAGSRGQDLRPIVATIQGEQDELIRADDKFLLIQGGAGTGKTVVALHRLAYLLYTYRVETRRQKELRVAVFGPNRLFLTYVASVLPSLGEADVFHTTFDEWFTRWCGRDTVKLPAWDDALDRLIGQRRQGDQSADALDRARRKGQRRAASVRCGARRALAGAPVQKDLSEHAGRPGCPGDSRIGPVRAARTGVAPLGKARSRRSWSAGLHAPAGRRAGACARHPRP